jgi:hypothetical protein
MKRKVGRPTDYNPAIVDQLCRALASSPDGLRRKNFAIFTLSMPHCNIPNVLHRRAGTTKWDGKRKHEESFKTGGRQDS